MYYELKDELNLSREFAKPHVLYLRNLGLIYLVMCVNGYYVPSGSGYCLTELGANLVKYYFYKEAISYEK